MPVGCPKPARPTPANLTSQLQSSEVVIGVFENLHWHRYSDEYRNFFISGIEKLAAAFPAVTFLIKPHNAGMWLTNRYDGAVPHAKNLVIADPQKPEWEAFTANDLLGNLSAVITTPSTVALDAARYELPVAVVWHSLLLENYTPLFAICNEDYWPAFVHQALLPISAKNLIEKAREFAANSLASDSAASKIIDDLLQLGKERVA